METTGDNCHNTVWSPVGHKHPLWQLSLRAALLLGKTSHGFHERDEEQMTFCREMGYRVKSESEVTQLHWSFATPWTIAYQAPLPMEFPRQVIRSRYLCSRTFQSYAASRNYHSEDHKELCKLDATSVVERNTRNLCLNTIHADWKHVTPYIVKEWEYV